MPIRTWVGVLLKGSLEHYPGHGGKDGIKLRSKLRLASAAASVSSQSLVSSTKRRCGQLEPGR